MTSASNIRFSVLRAPFSGRGLRKAAASLGRGAARGGLEAGWLLGALSADRPDLTDLTLDGPIWRSPSSTVFIGESPTLGRLALKICLDPKNGRPSETAARASFAALERAAALSHAAGGLEIATPVALLPRQGIVLSRWVEGERFSALARRAPLAEAEAAAADAGRWLAQLHRAGEGQARPLHVDQILADVNARFANAHRPATIVDVGLRRLRAAAPSLARHPVLWGPVHGDFKPDNLIVTPNGVSAIDFEHQVSGPGLMDAAHFLNHLDLGSGFPRPAFWPARAAAMGRAFLSAYATSNPDVAIGDELTWLRLADALRLLADNPNGNLPRRLIHGRRLRAMIRRLPAETAAGPNAG